VFGDKVIFHVFSHINRYNFRTCERNNPSAVIEGTKQRESHVSVSCAVSKQYVFGLSSKTL
jgi:hypothetical protein